MCYSPSPLFSCARCSEMLLENSDFLAGVQQLPLPTLEQHLALRRGGCGAPQWHVVRAAVWGRKSSGWEMNDMKPLWRVRDTVKARSSIDALGPWYSLASTCFGFPAPAPYLPGLWDSPLLMWPLLAFQPLLGTATFSFCPLPTVKRPGSVRQLFPRVIMPIPHGLAGLGLERHGREVVWARRGGQWGERKPNTP